MALNMLENGFSDDKNYEWHRTCQRMGLVMTKITNGTEHVREWLVTTVANDTEFV